MSLGVIAHRPVHRLDVKRKVGGLECAKLSWVLDRYRDEVDTHATTRYKKVHTV